MKQLFIKASHRLEIYLQNRVRTSWFSDLIYTVNRYKRTFGTYPNLMDPKTFNEKINHRKLFVRDPILTKLADKFEVREYVAKRIGDRYLNELFQVVDNPDDLNFDAMPNQFIIKATHGCGWNIIVEDKSQINRQTVKEQLKEWLGQNYYDQGREWSYKNIKPKIMVEKLLLDDDGRVPFDYKYYCFNSDPKFVHIVTNRFGEKNISFFDNNWELLNIHYMGFKPSNHNKPEKFEEMKDIAKKLAFGLKFVRVDLYFVQNQIFFGELTLYPNNGFVGFFPDEFDRIFGSYWQKSNFV